MYNVSIIDDDELSRLIIKKYIDKTIGLVLLKEYNSAIKALEDPTINKADILILDIEMPVLNGLEFIQKIQLKSEIIVMSIHDYALQSYNYGVTDFLSKPILYDRFIQSIDKVKRLMKSEKSACLSHDHIYVKNKNGYSRLNFDEINYIEAYSDYMNIYTIKGRYTALTTMKAFEERLPKDKFIRVHRSYLVHVDKISRFEDNMIRLGEKTIPVSRSCKENLVNHLNLF